MLTTETAAEKRLKRQLAELTDRLSRDVPPFSDSTIEASRDRHRLTRTDTDVFGRTYLPHYFENVSAAFHTDIDEMLGWPSRHLFVVHGPREHAKSSRARARLLQRLLGGEIRYWLFCSEHLNLATRHLEAFKAELTDNRRIGTDYACNVLKWDETGGTLRVRVKVRATGKTHTFQLEAISYGRPAKGRLYMSRRPEGCLVDDFENTRTSRNERIGWEKLIWLKQELYPAVTGPILWLGNTGHEASAMYQAMLDLHGGDDDALRAFLRAGSVPGTVGARAERSEPSNGLERVEEDVEPQEPDSDAGQVEMSCCSYRADTVTAAGTVYLWPERFPPSWYASMRATMNDALYEGEMNGFPIRVGRYFKAEWFGDGFDELPSGEMSWYLWLDPAFGKTESACYKAIALVATDRHTHFVVDAWMRQTDPLSDAIDWMYDAFERYPDLLSGGYENDFGQDNRLERDFQDAEERRGYPLPVSGQPNKGRDKARIESLQPLASTGRIRFPRRMKPDVKTLYNQLLSYPDGFVDGPDALESAINRNRVTAASRPYYKSVGSQRRYATAHVRR